MSAMQQHQSAMAAVGNRLRIFPEVQAPIDTIAELRAVIAKRDREIIDLKRQINKSSEDRAREWQDKCCALAAELAELRKSK